MDIFRTENKFGSFEIERDGFMEMIEGIMKAPKGTLAYEVRDDWAKVGVEINIDKLYESVE